ncbi:unnamed protein product, partial [Cyprideis torosa]
MAPKKAAYKRAPRLPAGMLISNETVSTAKDVFELDHVIGSGGFGDIYACTKVGCSTIPLAVKIEPWDNGPLYTEMHMMIRLSSKADREAFLQQKKISSINIPFLEGFGKFKHESQSFRFLVLPRYDMDLEKLMLLCPGKILPLTTCLNIGIQASVIFLFFKELEKLKAEQEPDYEKLRNILRDGIKAVNGKEGCLGLSDILQKAETQKRPSEDGGSADVPPPVKKRRAAGGRKNAPAAEASGKKKLSGRGLWSYTSAEFTVSRAYRSALFRTARGMAALSDVESDLSDLDDSDGDPTVK